MSFPEIRRSVGDAAPKVGGKSGCSKGSDSRDEGAIKVLGAAKDLRKISLRQGQAEQSHLRAATIRELALKVFGDETRAEKWLARPSDALEGKAPCDLMETEEGERRVSVLLERIAHGIAA